MKIIFFRSKFDEISPIKKIDPHKTKTTHQKPGSYTRDP
jgi:hypothetical protein